LFWLRIFRSSNKIFTIPNGVETTISELVTRIKNQKSKNIFCNHQLISYMPMNDGSIDLTFKKLDDQATTIIKTKKIIFAMPV